MKTRYLLLDEIRGLTLLSMIMYHLVWDLVYLFGTDWEWYSGEAGYLWQQSICWTFIFLSGFCWSLGKRKLKRGATIFIGGILITAVTVFVMPENRVVFGVLTLLGSCSLLMLPLEKLLKKCPPPIGLTGSIFLFVLFRNVNNGYLGFETWKLIKLPEGLYQNIVTTYLGFTEAGFFSTDYFSVLPWIFLYIAGYFCYQQMKGKDRLGVLVRQVLAPLEWLGRHSFEIYLVHQPVIYFVLSLCIGENVNFL